MKYTPHQYQQRAIKFLVSNAVGGLFMDPGLGKTSITLAALSILRKEDLVERALIIAPLRVVYSVWPEEAEKWDQFRHLSIGILHGPRKHEVLDEEHDVYLINPEGLAWLDEIDRYNEFDVLVVDESTKFKRTQTKRFKIMRKMIRHFDRRYILTGTPAPNGLMDLFGQIFMLDGGASLGPYVTRFRNKYFTQQHGGYDWTAKPEAKQQIYRKIKPLVLRLDQKDYLKMPERISTNVRISLPDKVQDMYNQIEAGFVAQLEAGEIVANNAATATYKLRQIASGGVYVDSPTETGIQRVAEHLHSLKTEALVDLVEQFQGQPTIIAYDTDHDLTRIKRAFGKDVPVIGGGVSAKKGKEYESLWNQEKLPILCLHPKSSAHGLNLQHGGCHCIWYSLTWDLEEYEQLIRRVWRQGQNRTSVFVYHIIARGTIDEALLRALTAKDKEQRSLLDTLRGFYIGDKSPENFLTRKEKKVLDKIR